MLSLIFQMLELRPKFVRIFNMWYVSYFFGCLYLGLGLFLKAVLKYINKLRFFWNYLIIFNKVNFLIFDWFFSKAGLQECAIIS